MTDKRQMKKIDMETLEKAEHKVSVGKLKKAVTAAVAVLIVAAGGYGAYWLITGEVVASRLTVNNMNCPACVVTVQEVTGKIPGVIRTDVSLAAQDVTVEFRSKQTNPELIKGAIVKAGYPASVDATFKPGGAGVDDLVVALVNGRPLFRKDLEEGLTLMKEGKAEDAASRYFSSVGTEILLQAADKETVVVQPYEVEEEVQSLGKKLGLSKEELGQKVSKEYGSVEKFNQMVARRLGIRKLLDDRILQGVQDSKERERKTLEWVGSVFKDADVKLLDPQLKEKVHAAAGQDDWKIFWPRMIGRKTELKSILIPEQATN
jgi:copper chaperone CopZ